MNPHNSDDEMESDSTELMEIDYVEDVNEVTNNPEEITENELVDITEIIEEDNNTSDNENDDSEDSEDNENEDNDSEDSNNSIDTYTNLIPITNLEYFFNNTFINENAPLMNVHPVVPFNIFELSNYQYIQQNELNNYIINISHDDDDTGEWLCTHCGNNINVIHKCCDTVYKWKCDDCDHSNDMNIIKCSNCDTLRTWNCPDCDHENNIHTAICLNCITRNNDLFKLTCDICNETKEYNSRFVCSECNNPRDCQCIDCLNNNLHLPYVFNDEDLDFTEFEDVEINSGLTEDEKKEIPQIDWTSDCKYDMCTICINKFSETNNKIYELNCKHKHCFHIDCLNDWLSKQNTCPNCRFKLSNK